MDADRQFDIADFGCCRHSSRCFDIVAGFDATIRTRSSPD